MGINPEFNAILAKALLNLKNLGMEEIVLELNSPITDEQWDLLTDVDFEHTDKIIFHTKNGKEVEFVKTPFIKKGVKQK